MSTGRVYHFSSGVMGAHNIKSISQDRIKNQNNKHHSPLSIVAIANNPKSKQMHQMLAPVHARPNQQWPPNVYVVIAHMDRASGDTTAPNLLRPC